MANQVVEWLLSPSGKTVGEILPTGTGYVLARGQTYEEWEADGIKIITFDNAVHWVLGDWLNAGENRFGQEFSQADALSKHRDEDWWQQVRRVAFQVRPENRRPELPWTYHQAVASLDDMEQRELLQEAIDKKWNLRGLKAQVALVKNDRTPLEIEQNNEAAAAYRAAKGGTPDTAPVRKIDDLTKEAREAKKAAAILKYQERRDLQERKAAEAAERRAAEARGEKLLPPRVVIPEPEGVVYDVLVADPWRDQGTTLADAIALPFLDLIADDALMFLWTRKIERLPDAMALLEAWGFDYRSRMIWRRTRATMTDYVREEDELLLIGRRGNPKMPAERDRPPSTIEAAAPRQGEHPDIFLQILERMFPHAKRLVVLPPPGDLPRAHRDHWHIWDAQPKGDQRAA